jgi:hypothetical protein
MNAGLGEAGVAHPAFFRNRRPLRRNAGFEGAGVAHPAFFCN